MKKIILAFFVLFFSSTLVAKDILEYEIEGMSIGDSLLDFLSEQEILMPMDKKFTWPNSKEYFQIAYNMNSKHYDMISFTLQENDNRYIIHSISGIKEFKKDFDKCDNFKKERIKNIGLYFPNITPNNYEYIYKNVDDGKSISYISDFQLNNGSIRIYCQDWSSVSENKRKWVDEGRVEIITQYIGDWLKIANQN